ncbi:MAG: hypothetical protein LBI78_00025 [Campylobacteraceae bacterium]|jgi:hypothetical protein|nr:hypothetical protein [Campylobacteraceae bacterium]
MTKGKNSDKSSIEKLEEIGLREVSRKTYIEFSYLKLMADREFSKLQRIKTLGFIKIIQREYNISMDDWVKEFEEYFQENSQNRPKEKKINDTLKAHKSLNFGKKLYILSAVLFLILFVIFAYSFTKERIGHIESTLANSDIIYYDDNESETDGDVLQMSDVSDETVNILAEDNATHLATIITNASNDAPKQNIAEDFKAVISPNTNIWVGIIDLATLRKRTYMQEQDIDLKLDKEQLVITGHGDFMLKIENKPDKKFNLQNRVYLYINKGVIEEIGENDFVLLNGGKNW